jgi:hypothetical protein
MLVYLKSGVHYSFITYFLNYLLPSYRTASRFFLIDDDSVKGGPQRKSSIVLGYEMGDHEMLSLNFTGRSFSHWLLQ